MKIYSSLEISEKTGIHIRKIQRMAKSGEIGQKAGHDYIYFDKDIEILLKKK